MEPTYLPHANGFPSGSSGTPSSTGSPPARKSPTPQSPARRRRAASIDELLAGVSAFPPTIGPHEVWDRHQEMDTEEQRGLVVRLCGLVHALVNEVEAEREQLLDAQGSLAEVVQRLVRQDEAWKDRNGHLEVQERAIRELATSNAKLRTTLMRQQRTPVHRPHSAAAKQQQRGGGGRWQLGELEAAAAARPHVAAAARQQRRPLARVQSRAGRGRTGATATPPPPDDDPKLRVYGAPSFARGGRHRGAAAVVVWPRRSRAAASSR